MLLVAGCVAQDEPNVKKEDKLQLSDKEITFYIDGWKPMDESRAAIFETSNDFTDENAGKGGGNFTLHAYLQESGRPYIDGTRVRHFIPEGSTIGTWEFFDNTHIIKHYWPQTGSVDFFAYMPYKNSDRQKYISIKEYNKTEGSISFACDMPNTTVDGDENTDDLHDPKGQETIIAYTKDKSKESGTVNMHFVHPFSAIYFKLKQAHRNLTIKWIRLNNVYLKGTSELTGATDANTKISWNIAENEKVDTFHIPVEKIIPDSINFGGEIGGPYLLMPQKLGTNNAKRDSVSLTVRYHWDDADDTTNDFYEITRTIATANFEEWKAGKKYTFVLDLGDNKEEILFKVEVEPWETVGNKNVVDVE